MREQELSPKIRLRMLPGGWDCQEKPLLHCVCKVFFCQFLSVCQRRSVSVFLSVSFCQCRSVSVVLSVSFCQCLSVSVFLSVSFCQSITLTLFLTSQVHLRVDDVPLIHIQRVLPFLLFRNVFELLRQDRLQIFFASDHVTEIVGQFDCDAALAAAGVEEDVGGLQVGEEPRGNEKDL